MAKNSNISVIPSYNIFPIVPTPLVSTEGLDLVGTATPSYLEMDYEEERDNKGNYRKKQHLLIRWEKK